MKAVSLVSSGIDSPVATVMLSQFVDQMILVHADNRPFTDEREIKNFVALAKHLNKIMSCETVALSVPHGPSLSCFQDTSEEHRFTCVICKRMIIRYAERIANRFDALGIVMGDSLGQVASQTLQNLKVVDQVVSLPILRPLIGYDKEHAIKIAKEIGTYDLSIEPSAGCTAVPSQPATQARLDQIIAEEKKMNINKLVDSAVSNAEEILF